MLYVICYGVVGDRYFFIMLFYRTQMICSAQKKYPSVPYYYIVQKSRNYYQIAS